MTMKINLVKQKNQIQNIIPAAYLGQGKKRAADPAILGPATIICRSWPAEKKERTTACSSALGRITEKNKTGGLGTI